jgi:calcium binding protein 39
MNQYISDAENLKLMMNLLRDKSRNIQFEAFHVFKVIHDHDSFSEVFVANPEKVPLITDILVKNKDRLLTFLSNFHTDRTDDEQFNDEKMFLIAQVQKM